MPRHSPCALCSLTTSSQLFSQLSNYVSSFSLIVVFLPSSKKISSNMKFSISMFATYFASSCSLFNFQDPIEKIADFFDLPYFPLSRKVWAFLLPFFKKSRWWAQASSHSSGLAYAASAAIPSPSGFLWLLPAAFVSKEPRSFESPHSTRHRRIALGFSFAYLFFFSKRKVGGGLKWTRTTDLTLIRRAL